MLKNKKYFCGHYAEKSKSEYFCDECFSNKISKILEEDKKRQELYEQDTENFKHLRNVSKLIIQDTEMSALIKSENMHEENTEAFILRSLRYGAPITIGGYLDAAMPRIPRLDPRHLETKKRIIEKVKIIITPYLNIYPTTYQQ